MRYYSHRGKYLERLVTHDATFKILGTLRLQLYSVFEGYSPIKLKKIIRSGDMLSRLKNDIDVLDQLYLNLVIPLLTSMSSLVLATVVIGIYSTALSIVVGVLMVTSIVIIPLICFLYSRKYERQFLVDSGNARAELAANMQGARELLMLNQTAKSLSSWQEHIKRINQHQNFINRSLSIAQSAIILCSQFSLLAALVMLLPQLVSIEIKIPVLVMIVMLAWVSFDEIGKIPLAIQSIPKIAAAMQRVFELSEENRPHYNPVSNQNSLIEFRNVCFSYDIGCPILRNLSFTAKAGDKIALIGQTGSGKTTILNLILGFYEADKGEVITPDISQISVVEQRPYVFDRTIEDNLRIAKPDVEADELEKACEIAGLSDFIRNLPKGYQTYVGENGFNISGGELKRLALARALLKESPFLILDEVGEGLDDVMEQSIMDRIITNTPNKCLIVITHNIKTAEKMNTIIDLSKEPKI